MLVQDDPTLEKRKAATNAAVAAVQPKQIIELVKAALGMAHSAAVIAAVMKPYTDDTEFNPANQAHAIEILVDCILAQLMETRNGNGMVAALAILCGTGIVERTPKHHPELISLANDICGAGMTATVPTLPKLAKLRAKIAEQITPVKPDAAAPPQIWTAIKAVFTAAAEDQREDVKFSEDLVQTFKAQQQQVNILWWMLGDWSNELDAPFEKVPAAAAPIIAGLELGHLIVTREIPKSVKAVLHKVLTKSGDINTKHSLIEAVNGCPRDWREKAGFGDLPGEIQDLTPVLLALQSSLATESKDTWQPVYEKAIGIKKFPKEEKLDIAVQVFREILLWQMAG